MCMEITTYQLASSLIAKGMDWKQAIGTVLLGNLIVLVPMLLNAHAGAKYGIPFPVFIRAPFGVRGANLAAILRAVVACGWFGIQSWIGGTAIHSMLAVIWPAWLRAATAILWACFLGFWLLNMVVVWRGVESIRHLQAFGAPFMFVMAAALLIWVRIKAGSFGTMLSTPSQLPDSTGEFLAVFFPSLTAIVGYWATLALNIPDFTRYSKSQSAQSWGQAFGLPVAMVLYTFVGISVTSASAVLFGHPIWNPILLIGAFHQPRCCLHRARCHSCGHAQREHRRQRCVAFERFLQSLSAAHQLSHRRPDYRLSWPDDVPLETAGHAGCLYFRMAGWLLRAARPRGWHHGRGLLSHSQNRA